MGAVCLHRTVERSFWRYLRWVLYVYIEMIKVLFVYIIFLKVVSERTALGDVCIHHKVRGSFRETCFKCCLYTL